MVYWCKWCSGVLVNMQLCLEMMKSHIKTDAKCIWFSFCNHISHFLGQALSWTVKHAVTCLPLCAPGVMTSLQGSLLPPCKLWLVLVTPLCACVQACYPLEESSRPPDVGLCSNDFFTAPPSSLPAPPSSHDFLLPAEKSPCQWHVSCFQNFCPPRCLPFSMLRYAALLVWMPVTCR